MSFIQVDQEFVVETDTTVSNTGEDIMRETGENTVPLSNSNKRSMTLFDTKMTVMVQLYSFIPDAELEHSILKYNPIPSNVPPHAPLDDFLKGVLEENHKYLQMQEDKLLQKMQQKVLNALGPLSKIWQKIEDSTQCKTDRVDTDLGEFKELTEQSIVMLGQVFNNITYHRRLSLLNVLMKEHKSNVKRES